MRPWIDGHLDLAYVHLGGRDLERPHDDPATGCVDLPALRAALVDPIFATIFTEPVTNDGDEASAYRRHDPDHARAVGIRQLQVYQAWARDGAASIVLTAADLEPNDHPTPRLVILMEGADPITGPDDVPFWFNRGVRIVGLTWAMGTRYAGGNAAPGPLTDAGRALVASLDAHGIVHDLSHLADEAVDQLLTLTNGRVVASHSNARTLHGTDDQRHLCDAHIRAIGERDGIVGLNLFAPFVRRDQPPTVSDAIAHVEHVTEIMGHRRGVALGSDMDGGFPPTRLVAGVDHPSRLEALADGLSAAGWSDAEITGFASTNWLRFLREVL
ncbi:MAG: membrane dipeptidase [Planctomycetota bacterium]